MKYLVTGAGRPNGLGAEMVRQLVAAGHEVIATARDPKSAAFLNVPVLALDVSSPASIAALQLDSLDVLINNAGLMENEHFGILTQASLLEHYAVNAVAPLLVAQQLLPALRKGQRKLVVHISTKMGSIEDNTSGGYYGYRMSKAALNMGARSMAHDLRDIITVAIHPGWVQTDMGGAGAPLKREDAMRSLLGVVERLGPKDSGTFLNYDGKPLPF